MSHLVASEKQSPSRNRNAQLSVTVGICTKHCFRDKDYTSKIFFLLDCENTLNKDDQTVESAMQRITVWLCAGGVWLIRRQGHQRQPLRGGHI